MVDLNPFDWISSGFDWVAGEVTAAAGGAAGLAIKAAGWTVGEVESVGESTYSFVVKGIRGVEHVFFEIVDEIKHEVTIISRDVAMVGHWAGSAARWIENADAWVITQVEKGAKAIEHDVIDPAINAVEHDLASVEHEALAAAGAVGTALATVERDVIAPIAHEVAALPSQIDHTVSGAIRTLERDVIDPVVHDTEWLMTHAPAVIDWVEKYGADIVKLVLDAAQWLVLLAEYTPEALRGLVELASGDLSLGALQTSAQGIPAQAPTLETMIGHLLG